MRCDILAKKSTEQENQYDHRPRHDEFIPDESIPYVSMVCTCQSRLCERLNNEFIPLPPSA